MTVVGVDGWKRGWVAAIASGRRIAWRDFRTFAEIVTAYPETTIAVDMPIGTSNESREADTLARRWLADRGGSPSSIFSTPPRSIVDAWTPATKHKDAMDGRAKGSKVSLQAWHLIEKIRQVAEAIDGLPDERVIEVHPECSFAALDRPVVEHSKKTAAGMALRLRALRGPFDLPDLVDAPRGVPIDDVLDATVCAWTAQHFVQDRANCVVLGKDSSRAPRIVIGPDQ